MDGRHLSAIDGFGGRGQGTGVRVVA
jgi:hypothetical protein